MFGKCVLRGYLIGPFHSLFQAEMLFLAVLMVTELKLKDRGKILYGFCKFIVPDGKVTELKFEDRGKIKDCSGYAGPEVSCWKFAKKGDDVSDKKLVANFITRDGKELLLVPRIVNSGKN